MGRWEKLIEGSFRGLKFVDGIEEPTIQTEGWYSGPAYGQLFFYRLLIPTGWKVNSEIIQHGRKITCISPDGTKVRIFKCMFWNEYIPQMLFEYVEE